MCGSKRNGTERSDSSCPIRPMNKIGKNPRGMVRAFCKKHGICVSCLRRWTDRAARNAINRVQEHRGCAVAEIMCEMSKRVSACGATSDPRPLPTSAARSAKIATLGRSDSASIRTTRFLAGDCSGCCRNRSPVTTVGECRHRLPTGLRLTIRSRSSIHVARAPGYRHPGSALKKTVVHIFHQQQD